MDGVVGPPGVRAATGVDADADAGVELDASEDGGGCALFCFEGPSTGCGAFWGVLAGGPCGGFEGPGAFG